MTVSRPQPEGPSTTTLQGPPLLVTHLRAWLGAWPPDTGLEVVGSPVRTRPGWDGAVHPFVGVAAPVGAVLSVPPDRAPAVRAAGDDLGAAGYGAAVARAMGRPDAVLGRGVFRWTTQPAALDDAGQWVAADDPRLPAWLRPFNGGVLVALQEGVVVAGVGVKRHDDAGREIAVVTGEAARGRGLARRLVAQAARRILADGAVPTYLHAPDNAPSARVAEAAGFGDRAWTVLGLWPGRA